MKRCVFYMHLYGKFSYVYASNESFSLRHFCKFSFIHVKKL
jgi:hypothetical protein